MTKIAFVSSERPEAKNSLKILKRMYTNVSPEKADIIVVLLEFQYERIIVANKPLIYLNGKISELQDTKISPFDRGFLWGDGVYEITPCFGNRLYRLEDHVDRLYRSLSYVRINPALSPSDMIVETKRLLNENKDHSKSWVRI
mgnify:CR=1 FL=1